MVNYIIAEKAATFFTKGVTLAVSVILACAKLRRKGK